ncbi:conserved Plasmodium protein, unknown function [Plasmodium sp. gorilla clade G2]|uniref:conserved Plasmodium protein, unknown function n=1 Tax=Plasmodium sp. gorilla clade G2 TaxID=880535 RepID=UPI000D221A8D|nr:conserved Plasmodium protein, unknown function [Plasmodium sp. gorilla clade G2]SOV18554.1 conserved Plasmodium protein, unknown function [Plasmodium sp. gorilla clade G2]
MTNCCFRCSIFYEDAQEEDYLFFDEYFLKDYNEKNDDTKIKEECNNKKEPPFLENNKQKFLDYIQNEADSKNCPLKDIYKDIYINFYVCKKCYGLHNIDIILFYNENSKFHHDLTKYVDDVLIIIDENIKNNIINNMKYIIESYTNNVDIIFFLLYLYVNNILNSNFLFNLQSYNEYYIKIKKFIVLQNIIQSHQHYLNNRIHKIFSYFLIYIFMFFSYNHIFKTLNLDHYQINLITTLYDNSVLVFRNKICDHKNNKINYKEHINDQNLDDIHLYNVTHAENDNFVSDHRKGYNKKRKKDNQKGCKNENIYKYDETNIYTHNKHNYNDNDNNADNHEMVRHNKDLKEVSDIKQREPYIRTTQNPSHYNEQEKVILNESKTYQMYISFNNLCICGYYNKYNKEISQTEWVINNISNSVLSIEECISHIFNNVFSFSTSTFIGSGREDKDARMMNIGRPFVYVLKDTKFSFLNFFLFFSNLSNKQKGLKNYNTMNLKTIEEYNQFLIQENKNKIKKEQNENILKNEIQKNINLPYDNNTHNHHQNDIKEQNLQFNDIYPLIKEKDENNSLSILDIKKNIFMNIFLHIENLKQQSYNNIITDMSQNIIHNIYNLNILFKLPISYSFNKELEILFSNMCSFKYNSNYMYSLNIKKDTETNILTNIKEKKEQMKKNNDNNNINNNPHDINQLTEIKLNNLSFSTNYELVKKLMKYGEERKKEYKCIIYHSSKMNKNKIQQINEQIYNYEPQTLTYVLNIMQKTPIRVLHRRSLINRERKIFQFKLIYLHEHFSLLYLLAQSGLYIKEFVNGDKGRTIPNLKQFFGDDTYVNILNLDVATLVYD